MQPGIVGLRGGLIAAWEEDLRTVRQDAFDVGRGREALLFTERFYGLISRLKPLIQRAWSPGKHVHVVDALEADGPGARVSQSRIRLRGQGDLVSVELFTYAEGTSQPSESAGLARNIQVVDVEPLALVTDLYRTAVDFLQLAMNIDLGLAGSLWLYEHTAASLFARAGKWPSVGDVYRRAAHEFAIVDSFESFLEMVTAGGIVGSNREARDMRLSLEQLEGFVEPQPDLDAFVKAVLVAVAADQDDRSVSSSEVAAAVGLDLLGIVKLGRLLSEEPDVVREAEFAPDFTSWTFMPSYNVHFFRRMHTIDDFLAIERSLEPRSGPDRAMPAAPAGTALKVSEHAALPSGTVTFLMTDVVESTLLWLQSRALMYQAMRRHDQLLAGAIEANGGVVLKERGEGDSFFAVFQRASDAVVAAVDAQRAIQAEEWPQGVSLAVRVALLTGEADATDRDYRSPAVNRCAKLRRRAIGDQILVSETTYAIVADILRDDIRLVPVGTRVLEGHERPEEIYVVQHPELHLEADVAPDEWPPTLSVLPGVEGPRAS